MKNLLTILFAVGALGAFGATFADKFAGSFAQRPATAAITQPTCDPGWRIGQDGLNPAQRVAAGILQKGGVPTREVGFLSAVVEHQVDCVQAPDSRQKAALAVIEQNPFTMIQLHALILTVYDTTPSAPQVLRQPADY